MKEPIASKEMVQEALGDDFDPMSEPAATKHTKHAIWPQIRAALCEVYDPEIPVSIYELGLMYDIVITEADGVIDVAVKMTLTSPNCPVAQDMPDMVRGAIMPIDGIGEVTVEITFDPPWTPSMMSEVAKLQLNMF